MEQDIITNPRIKITVGDTTILEIGLWEWIYLMMYHNYQLIPGDQKRLRLFINDTEIEKPESLEE